jgi:uncharacterized membrane protein
LQKMRSKKVSCSDTMSDMMAGLFLPFYRYLFAALSFWVWVGSASSLHAQELYQEVQATWRAEVVEVVSEEVEELPGLGFSHEVQMLEAALLEGPRRGDTVTVRNDLMPLGVGQKFFLNYIKTFEGIEIFEIQEVDRRGPLLFLVGLFVAVVIFFGRGQGLRSLAALGASLFLLFYALFPWLLVGHSPVLFCTLFALIVLIFAICFTHGFNKVSGAALLGTGITVVGAVILAELAVRAAHLSGIVEEASVYLNFDTGGKLDFQGLLLGAIIIGVLGVLDDVAVTQATAVKEIAEAAPTLTRGEVYTKALRVGREHVGALVNTLALAYSGSALPVLLLVYNANSALSVVNREIFAAEIVRTVVGSIAVIFCVPLSTYIATVFLIKKSNGD